MRKSHTHCHVFCATCMGNWELSETDVSTWNAEVAEVALERSEPGSSCPLDRTEDPEAGPTEYMPLNPQRKPGDKAGDQEFKVILKRGKF